MTDSYYVVTKTEKRSKMEFNFDETTLLEHKDNALNDTNSYLILSKAATVEDAEMQNVIHHNLPQYTFMAWKSYYL